MLVPVVQTWGTLKEIKKKKLFPGSGRITLAGFATKWGKPPGYARKR
jgi:hypothetical protein